MSNKCEVCGKAPVSGNNVSHSNRKTRRTWKPNLQSKYVIQGGVRKKVKLCTRCLRSGKTAATV